MWATVHKLTFGPGTQSFGFHQSQECAYKYHGDMKLLFVLMAGAVLLSAADLKIGKPLTQKEPLPIATLLAHPADYTDKTVQVKGKITDVCQMMGCWMALTNEEGHRIRISGDEKEIVFPKDSTGKMAIAEGKFVKLDLTRDQAAARAREEAETTGKKFDPASIKGAVTLYEIRSTSAVILSK
jgi:hypothetical protein